MKKLILIFLISIGAQISAQNLKMGYDWKNMNEVQRRDLISKMSPQERIQLLKQFKENMIVADLDIAPEKQEEFKKLFAEYQDSQKNIREQFRLDFQADNLSDAEARKKLDQSFEVGQQLLDVRKAYTEKFLKILTPQQVLKLFQNEGKMRDKVINRKQDGDFHERKQKEKP